MQRFIVVIFLLLFSGNLFAYTYTDSTKTYQFSESDFEVEFPEIIVGGINQDIVFKANFSLNDIIENQSEIFATIDDKSVQLTIDADKKQLLLDYKFAKKENLEIKVGGFSVNKEVNPIPLWMSILPPLIAIVIALVFREVFTALFLGILVGTTIIHFYQGSNFIIAVFQGIFSIADTYIIESLYDKGHLSIIVFSMMIGAMVNLITRNGGMKGVINRLAKYATNRVTGQFVTWFLGVCIFFDDYANTLVVGNTMRPVADKLKISREKLAYIVDSTAAPVASIAFITTWIGAELSYIQDGINVIGLEESAYNVFLSSLSYAFYPIFALCFILMIIFMRRDFGPMRKAELRMIKEGITGQGTTGEHAGFIEAELKGNARPKARNAVIPVLTIIFGTLAGLFYTGYNAEVWHDSTVAFTTKLSVIIGGSDSYTALLWSSLGGILVALLLTLSQRLVSLKDSVESLVQGFKTMLTAILILVLAWSIALITEHLHTADFISRLLVDFQISPYFVPALTFVMAALVAFSTGTSWGTMAIIYPLILPATWLIAAEFHLSHAESLTIFYNVVSTVLAGAVLGDHCSPISDTTILSSLASSCNHIEHVRTQLPYALTVGLVSVGIGTIPAAFGVSSYLLFPIGLVLLFLIVLIFGKKTIVT
jgi:Na+/H+ antiporter NhaC